jgi:hypothetical protein
MSDRPVRLPLRLELQRSRLWVHRWLVDGKHVAYINSFDEEPAYGPERIQVSPHTLPSLLETSINVHSIDPWQSPAWSDPKAPIRREESGLSADSKPPSYDEQEVLPDGGQEPEYLFRTYCERCSEYSPWFESEGQASKWEETHLDSEHEDPWAQRAIRVQRYPADDVDEDGNVVIADGGTRQLADPLGWPPHRDADPLDWPPTRGDRA